MSAMSEIDIEIQESSIKGMKFSRVPAHANVGTGYRGILNANYYDLVQIFGEPEQGVFKTDAEWVLYFEDGTLATIYNYKDGKNYLGADGLDVEDITEWHVGGFNQEAFHAVFLTFKANEECI